MTLTQKLDEIMATRGTHGEWDIPKLLAVIEKLIEQRDYFINSVYDDKSYELANIIPFYEAELLKILEN